MSKLYLGTSGYLYPHWRKGIFYPKNLPQKEEFNYYANILNSVEINSTFYGLPKPQTWETWEERAPENFIYSLKVSRILTHRQKLKNPRPAWEKFFAGAKNLKTHLGPILFQLPTNFSLNLARLKALAEVLPREQKFAFEFRDSSWFNNETYKILQKNRWALVFISHPQLPFIPKITTSFVYLRFHGSKALYSSEYSEKELQTFAKQIKQWLKKGLDIYGYFNNDAKGFAPKNALSLIQKIKKTSF
ncbi:MAG TPA: DUF72 domain-containing protein [Clostridia bacterium]|nr:DUF72 domain-containing protein [Clostridia bacterium]